MAYQFLEDHARAQYRLLNHNGFYTRVHCQDVEKGKLIGRLLVQGEEEFIKAVRPFNGMGNVFCGRNPRDENDRVAAITSVSFDLDPASYDHSKGSTHEQSQQCIRAANLVVERFAGGSVALSGNGALVLYGFEEPYQGDLGAFKTWFRAFSERHIGPLLQNFQNEVKLDPLYDNERLVKVVGTVSCRGPRRITRFLSVPRRSGGGRTILAGIKQIGGQQSEVAYSISNPVNLQIGEPKSDIRSTNGGLEQAIALIPHGERHNYLVRVAGALRRQGLNASGIFQALKSAYETRCEHLQTDGNIEERLWTIARSMLSYEPQALPSYRDLPRLVDSPDNRLDSGDSLILHSPSNSLEAYKQSLVATNGGKPELQTGIETLDKYTNGIRKGGIYIVAARPGVGKSSFLVQTAYNLCKEGKRVLYLSTEMAYQEIWNWFISHATGVTRDEFETKTFKEGAKETVERFIGQSLVGLQFQVCDSFSPTLRTVEKAVREATPDVLIFDHLQHIQGEAGKMRDYIAEFVKGLKQLASEKNVAILAAAQLSRPPRMQNFKTGETTEAKPVLSSLAECGKLEQEATVVVLMYKTGQSLDEDTPITTFEIAKNRFGRSDVLIDVAFHKAVTKFTPVGGI